MKCVICFFFFFFVKKIHWTFLKIYFWRPQIFSMLKMSSFVMAGSLCKIERARKNKITAQYFVDNYSFFDESSCLTLLIGLLKIFILFPLFLLLCIHYKLLVFWAGYFYMNVLSSQITTRTHCCTIATPSATTAASPARGRKKL